MQLTITTAENGFVVDVDEGDDIHYYFVALDVQDVCSIIENILVDNAGMDMSHLAFEAVQSDR